MTIKIVSTDIPDDPPTLDPQRVTDMCSARILNNVLEGLVRIGPNKSLVPGMAKDWIISSDETCYVFNLCNSYWNDGSKVTAYDFEFSWKRNLDPNFNSQYAFLMYWLKNGEAYHKGQASIDDVGVKAKDEDTLIVTLEKPNPDFVYLTTFPVFLPVKKGLPDIYGDKFASSEKYTLFNGPFCIIEWKCGEELTIEKNSNYYDHDTINLDRIKWIVIKDADRLIKMYDEGVLDTIYRVPNEYIRTDFHQFSNIKTGPDCLTEFLIFNFDIPFFKNEKIRKALSLSLKRNDLLGDARIIGFKPAYGLIPPDIAGGVRLVNEECFREDIYEAKHFFNEGLKEVRIDKGQKIVLVGENTTQGIQYMEKITKWWNEVFGIEFEIVALPLGDRIKRIKRREFDIAMVHWRADYDDAMSYLELFKTNSSWNYSHWSDTQYDLLLDNCENRTDEHRNARLAQAERLLLSAMPLCPIYYQVRPTLLKPNLKDLVYSGIGCDQSFKWAKKELISKEG
jgi:oligopeptide transport system substrate-binding protein